MCGCSFPGRRVPIVNKIKRRQVVDEVAARPELVTAYTVEWPIMRVANADCPMLYKIGN